MQNYYTYNLLKKRIIKILYSLISLWIISVPSLFYSQIFSSSETLYAGGEDVIYVVEETQNMHQNVLQDNDILFVDNGAIIYNSNLISINNHPKKETKYIAKNNTKNKKKSIKKIYYQQIEVLTFFLKSNTSKYFYSSKNSAASCSNNNLQQKNIFNPYNEYKLKILISNVNHLTYDLDFFVLRDYKLYTFARPPPFHLAYLQLH